MKVFVKAKYPTLYSKLQSAKWTASQLLWKSSFAVKTNREIFNDIYKRNFWEDAESRSGIGSNLEQTRTIREQLPVLTRDLAIKSFMDAPCGDLHWMKEVDLGTETYIGCDIVDELIEDNRKKYADQNRRFLVLDVTKDAVPTVDMIFCRDLFVHLSFREIHRALENFKKSNSSYLLTTTYTKVSKNTDALTGDWRSLNLQIPPFNFPEPIRLINENCTERNGRSADKSLGCWKISDLP